VRPTECCSCDAARQCRYCRVVPAIRVGHDAFCVDGEAEAGMDISLGKLSYCDKWGFVGGGSGFARSTPVTGQAGFHPRPGHSLASRRHQSRLTKTPMIRPAEVHQISGMQPSTLLRRENSPEILELFCCIR